MNWYLLLNQRRNAFCPLSSLRSPVSLQFMPLENNSHIIATSEQHHCRHCEARRYGIRFVLIQSFTKQKWWGRNRVNNCLICHWDLLMGRIRMVRADLGTTNPLLLQAASLAVYHSSAKRSWSKIKTKGDSWTRGGARWIYSDDTVMAAGDTGS